MLVSILDLKLWLGMTNPRQSTDRPDTKVHWRLSQRKKQSRLWLPTCICMRLTPFLFGTSHEDASGKVSAHITCRNGILQVILDISMVAGHLLSDFLVCVANTGCVFSMDSSAGPIMHNQKHRIPGDAKQKQSNTSPKLLPEELDYGYFRQKIFH